MSLCAVCGMLTHVLNLVTCNLPEYTKNAMSYISNSIAYFI